MFLLTTLCWKADFKNYNENEESIKQATQSFTCLNLLPVNKGKEVLLVSKKYAYLPENYFIWNLLLTKESQNMTILSHLNKKSTAVFPQKHGLSTSWLQLRLMSEWKFISASLFCFFEHNTSAIKLFIRNLPLKEDNFFLVK